MTRTSRTTLVACLALGVAGASACRDHPKRVVYDLAARAAVAEHGGQTDVVLFGTPGAEARVVGGLSDTPSAAPGEPSLRSSGEPELRFDGWAPEDRVAVLDAAPDAVGLAAEVWLNDTPVERFRLNDARYRYRIPLPAAAQAVGQNRLRFSFAPASRPTSAEGEASAPAVVVYSLVVGPASDPRIEDLLSRDAPRPYGVDREGGVPRVHMAGPATIRFAVRLPGEAELRFTPELAPGALAAAGSARFRVLLQGEDGPEVEVWAARLDHQTPALPEQVVGVAGKAGEISRLTLAVDGPGSGTGRFAWGTWGAPRLLGHGHPDPLEPAPVSPADEERAAGLRKTLEGANVVLVVLDAARARQLGTYGYPRETTPEIDRIAAEGVVFEHAYTPASYTLAAMSSLWTSQHPDRHHRDLSFSAQLPHDKLTLAELLSGEGLFTIGFTANAMTSAAFGLDRGFEEFHEVFRTLGDRASAFREVVPPRLAELSDRRFFAYVHYREPHFPYDPEPPFDTMFGPEGPIPLEARREWRHFREVNQGRRPFDADAREHLVRLYDGNLAFVDREVGALRQALEDEGLWDRTVFIVTADHGEELFEHGFVGHNVHVYEPSVRIPLIVRFPPGVADAGARVGGFVDLRDLAPTIADVFGVRGRGGSDRQFQGRSLLPVIAGAAARSAVLSRTVWDRPRYGLREGRFTYLLDTRTGEERLYDRDVDPGETRDIGNEHPLRMALYRQALHHWMRQPGPEGPAAGKAAALSPEQCRNLRLLGYVEGECQ